MEKRVSCRVLVLLFITIVLASAAGQDLPDQGMRALEEIQNSFRAVAKKVLPSVVAIDTVTIVTNTNNRLPFFFQPRDQSTPNEGQELRRPGLGSGVIVRKTGDKLYVLTNNHVVGDAEEIKITLNDGREFAATLVGRDEKKDLALVVFETGETIPVADIGDSNDLQVGDWAIAVGNPLGFASTVTAGIVSAIGRNPMQGQDVGSFTDYIQTDAAINQGNSGGALVNLRGEVIGINTWIASPYGGNIGLGFAIPINNAKKAIDDFISEGKIDYGWLGISVGDVPDQIANEMKVKNRQGAMVFGVFKDSPADKAGILPGDFIYRIGTESIRDMNHILSIIGNLPPGATATFTVMRYGDSVYLTPKIEARAEDNEISGKSGKLWPGISVVTVTDALRNQLKLLRNAGDLIIGSVSPGSPAEVGGLRTGDIINKVDGKDVKTVMDFYRNLNESQKKDLLFEINREGTRLVIGLPK